MEPEESTYFFLSEMCWGMKAAMVRMFSPRPPRTRPEAVLDQDAAAIPVEELNLSARTFSCLNRANIRTVGELAAKSDEDLRAIPNFGKKCLWEVYDILELYGTVEKDEDGSAE